MARLIGFFAVFALFLTFIILNLDNKCSVNFGFYTFPEVPVYISAFISIFTGMIISIPLLSSLKKKKDSSHPDDKHGSRNKHPAEKQDEIPGINGPYGIN